MSREHAHSLRQQLIEAIACHDSVIDKMNSKAFAERFFQEAIWPTLDRAMEAGELLVARNTVKQTPVDIALKLWLNGCIATIGVVREHENVISKAALLKMLYSLDENATRALRDANALEN